MTSINGNSDEKAKARRQKHREYLILFTIFLSISIYFIWNFYWVHFGKTVIENRKNSTLVFHPPTNNISASKCGFFYAYECDISKEILFDFAKDNNWVLEEIHSPQKIRRYNWFRNKTRYELERKETKLNVGEIMTTFHIARNGYFYDNTEKQHDQTRRMLAVYDQENSKLYVWYYFR
jgi:hypothetical protein